MQKLEEGRWRDGGSAQHLSRLPAFWGEARNAVGCEMFLFRFIGFVQPSPNRGCHFQRGRMGGLCSEHLCGTVAGKGSFPVVSRELNVAGCSFSSRKALLFVFLSSRNWFAGWTHKWYKMGLSLKLSSAKHHTELSSAAELQPKVCFSQLL